jgi:hypothetical protein
MKSRLASWRQWVDIAANARGSKVIGGRIRDAQIRRVQKSIAGDAGAYFCNSKMLSAAMEISSMFGGLGRVMAAGSA